MKLDISIIGDKLVMSESVEDCTGEFGRTLRIGATAAAAVSALTRGSRLTTSFIFAFSFSPSHAQEEQFEHPGTGMTCGSVGIGLSDTVSGVRDIFRSR